MKIDINLSTHLSTLICLCLGEKREGERKKSAFANMLSCGYLFIYERSAGRKVKRN